MVEEVEGILSLLGTPMAVSVQAPALELL